MPAFLRPIVIFVLVFMLLGIFASSYLGPMWLKTSLCGFTQDQLTSRPCEQTVVDATALLIRYQLYGMGAGAGFGLILGVIFALRGRGEKNAKNAKNDNGPPDSAPPPASA